MLEREIHLTPESIRDYHALVDRSGGPDACWPWQGAFYMNTPYGDFGWGAHIVAFFLAHGRQPQGQVVRHVVCNNPPCCNPAHLAEGSYQDNMEDAKAQGRLKGRRKKTPVFLTYEEKREIALSKKRKRVLMAEYDVSADVIAVIRRNKDKYTCPQHSVP